MDNNYKKLSKNKYVKESLDEFNKGEIKLNSITERSGEIRIIACSKNEILLQFLLYTTQLISTILYEKSTNYTHPELTKADNCSSSFNNDDL